MDEVVSQKLENFFSNYQKVNFKKSEIIIRADDRIREVYLLTKGLVRQYYLSSDGEEVTIHIFTPLSFFPIMLILGHQDNDFFFEAIDQVEVWKAPKDRVVNFIKEDAVVLFDLTKRFAAGLNGLSKRIADLTVENAYQRVTSLLLYLAKKFGTVEKEGTIINLTLTHNEIAQWVNLTRETTSRQLEKLELKKIISHHQHKIIIRNLDILKAQITQ